MDGGSFPDVFSPESQLILMSQNKRCKISELMRQFLDYGFIAPAVSSTQDGRGAGAILGWEAGGNRTDK